MFKVTNFRTGATFFLYSCATWRDAVRLTRRAANGVPSHPHDGWTKHRDAFTGSVKVYYQINGLILTRP